MCDAAVVARLVAREHLLLLHKHHIGILTRAREQACGRESDDAAADHHHAHRFTISAMTDQGTTTHDPGSDVHRNGERPTIVIHAGAGDHTSAMRRA